MSNVGRKKNGAARSNSKSQLTGALQAGGRGKWKSRIRINGKSILLRNNSGTTYFQSPEEAHDAYIKYAVDHGINLSI